ATLVAAVAVARAAAPTWARTLGRRMAPPDGLGRWFAEETSTGAAAIAIVSALLVTFVLVEVGGIAVAAAGVSGVGAAMLGGGPIGRLRRQLEGDGYGASIKITEAAILLAAALLVGGTVA